MSWTLSASGHTKDAAAEKRLVDKLREVMKDEAAGVSTANMTTQHQGTVNLTK